MIALEDIVCCKCNNVGEPITRIATFCPYDAPDVYRVEHFCDQYPFPEARKYLHGNLAVSGDIQTELFSTKEEAIRAWLKMNRAGRVQRFRKWLLGQ